MTHLKTIISIIAILIVSYISGARILEHDIKDITLGKFLILTGFGLISICLSVAAILPLYIVLNNYFEGKKETNE